MIVELVAINDRRRNVECDHELSLTREKEETTCKQLYSRALREMGKATAAAESGNLEEMAERDTLAMELFMQLLSRDSIRNAGTSSDQSEADTDTTTTTTTTADHSEPFADSGSVLDSATSAAELRALQNNVLLYLKYLALKNMGAVYCRHDRFNDAAICYSQAVNIDPTDVMVWYELAVASSRVGDYAQARMALEHALELSPDNQLVMELLMEVLYIVQDYGYCAVIAQRVVDANEQCDRARVILNECLRVNPHYHIEIFGPRPQTLLLLSLADGSSDPMADGDDGSIIDDLRKERSRLITQSVIENQQLLRTYAPVTSIRLDENTWECLGRHLMTLMHHWENNGRGQHNLNDRVRIVPITTTTTSSDPSVVNDSQSEQTDEGQSAPNVDNERSTDGSAEDQDKEAVQTKGRKRKKLSGQHSPDGKDKTADSGRRSKRLKHHGAAKEPRYISNMIKSIFHWEVDTENDAPKASSGTDSVTTEDTALPFNVESLSATSFMAFLSSLQELGGSLGLLDTAHLFVEVICSKYWSLLWPPRLSYQVRKLALRLHNIGFSFTEQTIVTLAELFFDRCAGDDTPENQQRLAIGRKFLSILLGHQVTGGTQLSLEDTVRVQWLLCHMEQRSRNTHLARRYLEHAAAAFGNIHAQEIIIPNCVQNKYVSEGTIAAKYRELDYVAQVDLAEEHIQEKDYVKSVETIMGVIHALQSPDVETRAKNMVIIALSNITDVNCTLCRQERWLDLVLFFLRGIDGESLRSNSKRLLRSLANLCQIASPPAEASSDEPNSRERIQRLIIAEYIRIAEEAEIIETKDANVQIVARVFMLLYRLTQSSISMQARFNLLRFLRTILTGRFAMTVTDWFFIFLIDELYSLLLQLRQNRRTRQVSEGSMKNADDRDTSSSDTDDDELWTQDDEEEILEELFINFWILYGVKLGDPALKYFKSAGVSGKKLAISSSKKMSAIALDLLAPFADDSIGASPDLKKGIRQVLEIIHNGFKDIPDEIAVNRELILCTIDGQNPQWQGNIAGVNKVIEEMRRISENLSGKVDHLGLYQSLYYYLGRYNTSIAASTAIIFTEPSPQVHELVEGVQLLESACLCAPMDGRTWYGLAEAYRLIGNGMADFCDLPKQHDQVFNDEKLRGMLRLPDKPDFYQDLKTILGRAVYCSALACTLMPDDEEALESHGLILGTAALGAWHSRGERFDAAAESIAGLVRKELLTRSLECFKRAMDRDGSNFFYPMNAAMVLEMMGSTDREEIMELYLKSAKLKEEEEQDGSDISEPEALLRLQIQRINLLCQAGNQQAHELAARFTFDNVDDELVSRSQGKNTFIGRVPKTPEPDTLMLASADDSGNVASTWRNVYDALLHCLVKDPFSHKALYLMANVLMLGPWRNFKQAQAVLSIMFRSKGSPKKPDGFQFDMEEDFYDGFIGSPLFRRWKGKIADLYGYVLSVTGDLDQLSMLTAGLRRSHVQSEPMLFDAYLNALLHYENVLTELSGQHAGRQLAKEEESKLQRHIGELFIYVNDSYWDDCAGIPLIRERVTALKDQWIAPEMSEAQSVQLSTSGSQDCVNSTISTAPSSVQSPPTTDSRKVVDAVVAWCREKFNLDFADTRKNRTRKAIEEAKTNIQCTLSYDGPVYGASLLPSSLPLPVRPASRSLTILPPSQPAAPSQVQQQSTTAAALDPDSHQKGERMSEGTGGDGSQSVSPLEIDLNTDSQLM